MPHVFVYGTLMAGESNHHLLHGATYLGPAQSPPGYTLYDFGPYPGMVPAGDGVIVGELYDVPESGIPALDRLEGHPDFYRRTSILLEDERPALTYLLRPDQVEGLAVIAEGDWRRRFPIGS